MIYNSMLFRCIDSSSVSIYLEAWSAVLHVFLFLPWRPTEAIRGCSDRSSSNTIDSWWQWKEGVESSLGDERRGEVFHPCLPFRWRLHSNMDTLWEETHLLLPWHQILLWTRRVFLPWGNGFKLFKMNAILAISVHDQIIVPNKLKLHQKHKLIRV